MPPSVSAGVQVLYLAFPVPVLGFRRLLAKRSPTPACETFEQQWTASYEATGWTKCSPTRGSWITRQKESSDVRSPVLACNLSRSGWEQIQTDAFYLTCATMCRDGDVSSCVFFIDLMKKN